MLILKMKISSLFVTFLLLQFCKTQNNNGPVEYNVDMEVFSGRSNPTWRVNTRSPVYDRLSRMLSRVRPTRMKDKLGYRGFVVEARDALGNRRKTTVGAGSSPALEMLLLNSSPYPLEGAVKQTVMDAIRRTNQQIFPVSLAIGNFNVNDDDALPVCRPPTYNPTLWNRQPTVRLNNCYNYATQRRTNTFAQPGRATGRQYSRPIEARNVLYATIRDGFIPVPFFRLRTCVIALAVWPGVDYHFYRLDSNRLWSHKPGRTNARNTDNSGQLIVDPRTADRGEYVVFAGYLLNQPAARVT